MPKRREAYTTPEPETIAKLAREHAEDITAEWDQRAPSVAEWPIREQLKAQARHLIDVLGGQPADHKYEAPLPPHDFAHAVSILRESIVAIAKRRAIPVSRAALDRAADRVAFSSLAASYSAVEQRAVAARNTVMSLVSHDLRNPLGTISISTEVLAQVIPREEPPSRARKAIEVMRRAVEQMQRLISDLTDIAAIESGRLKVELGEHDPIAVAREAAEQSETAAEKKRVRFVLRIDPAIAADAKLSCDRDRVLQVLGNLLANALAMTPPEGTIELALEQRGKQMRFTVADSGPGIEPELRSRVFDPYWRGRDARYLGRGLGLAIGKGLVEAHGGKIWVEESALGGAAFIFEI